MRAWVDHIAGLAGADRLWTGGFQFGDWLDPTAPPDAPYKAQADPDVVATAHLARSAEVVGLAAAVVGDADMADKYARLAGEVREAFAREYVTAGGRVLSDCPDGLCPGAGVGAAADRGPAPPCRGPPGRPGPGIRLPDQHRVRRHPAGHRRPDELPAPGRGLPADAPDRLPVLAVCGDDGRHHGLGTLGRHAARRRHQPGPDDLVQPLRLWRGGRLAAPHGRGPRPGGPRLPRAAGPARGGYATWISASARHRTPYGDAEVSWERSEGRLRLRVVVPVGATATVHVPGRSEPVRVGHGTHVWQTADPAVDGPLPAQASVRDVLDHEQTWRQVVAAAVEAGVASDEAQAAARLQAVLDAPSSRLIDALAPPGLIDGGQALHAQLDSLLPP